MDLRAEIVQHSYFMANFKQVAREMSADKSGSAGDENVHTKETPLQIAVCISAEMALHYRACE
jgi:hypothetical protein